MPRIRTVKPDYPKSRKTRKVSRDARLLNIHLWNLADDEGRLQELPRWIIGEIFPADEDVTPAILRDWLDELANAGLIVRYEVDGEQYIYCHDWADHQSISHAKKSVLPAPPDVPVTLREASGKAPDRKGREGKGKETALSGKPDESAESEPETIRRLCAYWQEQCDHPRAKVDSSTARYRKVRARLRQGFTPRQIATAIKGAAKAPYENDDGKRFDDLELICRNAEKLEDFMARAEQRPKGGSDYLAKLSERAA